RRLGLAVDLCKCPHLLPPGEVVRLGEGRDERRVLQRPKKCLRLRRNRFRNVYVRLLSWSDSCSLDLSRELVHRLWSPGIVYSRKSPVMKATIPMLAIRGGRRGRATEELPGMLLGAA